MKKTRQLELDRSRMQWTALSRRVAVQLMAAGRA